VDSLKALDPNRPIREADINEVPGGGKLDEGTFNIAEPSSRSSSLEKLTAGHKLMTSKGRQVRYWP
jgi:hypothetical protein